MLNFLKQACPQFYLQVFLIHRCLLERAFPQDLVRLLLWCIRMRSVPCSISCQEKKSCSLEIFCLLLLFLVLLLGGQAILELTNPIRDKVFQISDDLQNKTSYVLV